MDTKKTQTAQRAQLALKLSPSAGGFDIFTISAGTGNGWSFDPSVFLASLPCWRGVEFIFFHCITVKSKPGLGRQACMV